MLSEPQNTSVIRKATVASSPLAKETSFMSHKGGGSVSCTVNSQRKIPILSKKHFFIPILFRYLLFRHYLIVILISILGYTNILKFITAFQRSGLITKVATGSFYGSACYINILSCLLLKVTTGNRSIAASVIQGIIHPLTIYRTTRNIYLSATDRLYSLYITATYGKLGSRTCRH